MKIGEAKPIYYVKRKELTDQMNAINEEVKKAKKRYELTHREEYREEAATLELSFEATEEAFKENQKILDALNEHWDLIAELESTKQQGEDAAKEAENLGKIMTVFRRMANGDSVPQSDEKKLMEYDSKMYAAAKNMQSLARELKNSEHKKYGTLWEDEEKVERKSPFEVADNAEYSGDLPDIKIPEMPKMNVEISE